MYKHTICVKETRQAISHLPVSYNHCPHQVKDGKKSQWTSSCSYLSQDKDMTRSLCSLTVFLKELTSSPCILLPLPLRLPRSSSPPSFETMVSLRLLFLTETLSSPATSGKVFFNTWERRLPCLLHSTHKQTDKLSE